MNITKMVAASGAAVLAIAAVFAGATKPTTTLSTVFYTVASVCNSFTVGTSPIRFTTAGAGTQATIKTAGGTRRNLWGLCSAGTPTKPAHFKH